MDPNSPLVVRSFRRPPLLRCALAHDLRGYWVTEAPTPFQERVLRYLQLQPHRQYEGEMSGVRGDDRDRDGLEEAENEEVFCEDRWGLIGKSGDCPADGFGGPFA